MSEQIRSFIAVALPPETVAKLGAAQNRVRPVAKNVKWVAPDPLHITLKFLGGVEPERLERTWEAVRLAAAAGRHTSPSCSAAWEPSPTGIGRRVDLGRGRAGTA